MRRLVGALAAVLLVVSVSGCADSAPAAHRLPDVRLSGFDADNPAVALKGLRGPLVINLWASWCAPCRRDLPFYEAFHQAHPGVKLLGVDWQDTSKGNAAALIKRTGVSYPLVVGSGDQLPAQGLPKVILVDAKGEVAYQGYVEIKSVAQLERLVTRHLGADL